MGERLTITEAARRLGVSRPHIYALIRRGQLRAVKHPTYAKGTWVLEEDVTAFAQAIAESQSEH